MPCSKATGVFSFTVSGNGYTQDFSQYIGDITTGSGLPGATRAYFGVVAATGGCWENHLINAFTWLGICTCLCVRQI